MILDTDIFEVSHRFSALGVAPTKLAKYGFQRLSQIIIKPSTHNRKTLKSRRKVTEKVIYGDVLTAVAGITAISVFLVALSTDYRTLYTGTWI